MKFVNVISVTGIWTRKLPEDLTKGAIFYRTYAKKAKSEYRRATVDIPTEVNAICPEPCKRRDTKKKGILHKIKLKIVEGGTNFGTPFRRLKCEEKVCKEVALVEPKSLLVPAPKPDLPPPRPGVQVSILGADTNLGQYIALLLKQCPCFKKLRLYEARQNCDNSLCRVCNDLRYINTSCLVEAFTCTNNDLERCLQNTDIVLMLDNGNISMGMPLEERFMYQAPLVKHYADVIATECPKAFIVVCASPIDCMVPLVAETLKETGWYDPRKLLGSLAVPEMRASTLAARALCLEPSYVKVPCVGGTEGNALVPLFSKAVDLFDFTLRNAEMMVQTIRDTPAAVARLEGDCNRAAELSEAHAIAGLVTKVAWALLCKDVPRLSAFVETDSSQIISPARFMGNTVEIDSGMIRNLGLMRMSDNETILLNLALGEMLMRQEMVRNWYMNFRCSSPRLDEFEDRFFMPKCYKRLQDCAYASMFLGIQVLLNNEGIFKKFDIPHKLYPIELDLLDVAFNSLTHNVQETLRWYNSYDDEVRRGIEARTNFLYLPRSSNDKLLNKLEENEPELATSPEEECVICVNAKATMQTSPCGHRVVCRRCFVKTIQMAVSQRLLPLRCVICRAKILRLRQAPRLVTSKSWQVSSGSGRSWGVPGSVSSYSVGARSVPASASLYSVTSGESSISGVSSASSNSGSTVTNNCTNSCSTKLCGGAKCGGACLGAVPRVPSTTAPPRPRQPASNSLRRSQTHSMKARLQDYQVHSYTGGPVAEPAGRLPPIREFQREFREGRRESVATASSSTRIRCAQKIVTQLETSPQKNKQHFFRPLKPLNKDDPPKSRDHSKETDKKKENPKAKPKKEEKKKKEGDENAKQPEKTKKDESSDNKKNELAERKKEEKLRLKAEKEAKKEAKLQAKEEERQAKLLAKEEERQAKLLAKEEKKKAKKEAKIAAQAEKEKSKQN